MKNQNFSEQSNRKEGPVAKATEAQTSKLPSDLFLWSAIGSMVLSAGFQIFGRRQTSMFVGQWAPAILIMGLYSKVVNVAEMPNKAGVQSARPTAA